MEHEHLSQIVLLLKFRLPTRAGDVNMALAGPGVNFW